MLARALRTLPLLSVLLAAQPAGDPAALARKALDLLLSLGRLTMSGFAVAVAAAAAGRPQRTRAVKASRPVVSAPKRGRLARAKGRAA